MGEKKALQPAVLKVARLGDYLVGLSVDESEYVMDAQTDARWVLSKAVQMVDDWVESSVDERGAVTVEKKDV